jgi:sulfatase modifying factor 1
VHAPVGTYAPNGFGLADATGNLFEWCLDGYSETFYGEGARRDPLLHPSSGVARTVYRGGGFAHPAAMGRSASRWSNSPSISSSYLGVRPARAIGR